jgi:hypothetical protein
MAMEDPVLRSEEAARAAACEYYCEGVLEEYNSWCNGEVYGVCVDVFHKGEMVTDDSVWGHVGGDWAEEALRDQMSYWVEQWLPKQPVQKELAL